MPYTLVQAGTNLVFVDSSGNAGAPLTIPPGVVMSSTKPARFLNIDGYSILVNTPSQPLIIDSLGVVRPLVPRPPRVAPVLAGVAGGTLSGTYTGVRYSFITKDANGNIISESGLSPASGAVTITTQFLQASGLDISPDPSITGRRLYRPTSNGSVLFQWVDLDGNTLTSVQDDLADAKLSLIGQSLNLGTPPYLTNIAQFRGRLFGVTAEDIDHLRYTEAGLRYAWPEQNILEVQSRGYDSVGITALAGRREALGVSKSNQFSHVTGTGASNADGTLDFDVVVLSKELGCLSQESMAVYRDTAYFLWYDGVYSWDSRGFRNLSEEGGVDAWFTTNSYFNRARFTNAFAAVDPIRTKYRLCLAQAGTNYENTWVEYDIPSGTWWGPHTTAAFTPSASTFVVQPDGSSLLGLGSVQGDLNLEQATRTDGTSTAINFDVVTKAHDMSIPDKEKYFGELTMIGKVQPSGTLVVTSSVGELLASSPTYSIVNNYVMTNARQRLSRLGVGKHCSFELTNNQVGVDVELYGYIVDPVNEQGRR